jgi:transposase InsO family protein
MIAPEIKRVVAEAADEARRSGARMPAICDLLELSARTLQRWKLSITPDGRKGSPRHVPRKLTEAERQRVKETICSPRFTDMYPPEIVATLASEGVYLASESTMYRIMREEKLLSHRRKSKAPEKREKPRLKATAPDQVYSWDITWMKSSVTGIYFYLYMVVDVFSRRIVEWEIHERESSAKAAAMLRRLSGKKVIKGVVVHSDNGAPMRGLSMLATMQQLGVVPSFSRPHVSTDNPYSESLFRTLKYRPSYPGRFETIDEAKDWTRAFVYWYNHKHMHSGISFVTPHERHYGKDVEILKVRRKTYRLAYKQNPARWSRGPQGWKRKEVVYINPAQEEIEKKLAS